MIRDGAPVSDGYQTRPGAPTLFCSRLARVRPMRGEEVFDAEGKEARRPMMLRLRWDSATRAISETDRLVLAGQLYEIIVPPVEIGRGAGLELIALARSGPIPDDVAAVLP